MAQRHRVAVLFCDLVGSTALLSQLGEDANDELRRDVFRALRRPVEAVGGDEIKSQGDGLMVAFTSADDAVTCAVEQQRALTRLDARDPDVSLALRVGVAWGEATAEEDDWFGTPVVEAARLCAAARSRQVLITDAVRQMLTDATGLVDAGRLELKGLPEPRQAWSVPWSVDEQHGPLPMPPALQVPAGQPLVGRAELLDQLASAWQAAARGSARTVILTGEAGSGTTRLAAEVAGRAVADGALVLHGRCLAGGDGREAIAEALRWYVAGAPVAELQATTGSLRPALDELVPALAIRLGSGPAQPATSPAADDEPAEATDLAPADVAALRLVGRLAGERPVLLAIDDAHHLGPAGATLLGELALGSLAPHLLLVVLGRHGTAAPSGLDRLHTKLEGAVGVTTFAVGGLDATSVAALLGVPPDGDVAALAVEETGGNPARVQGLVRQLRAAGLGTGEPDVADVRAAIARSSPYKGLATYGADDRDLLYGRDALRDAVLERLATTRLVVLVGASGSGKSSLVRAAVLPALADGALPGSATWSQVAITPGDRPGAVLDELGLDRPGEARLVLVDQLEELFTLCGSAEERQRFLRRVLAAAGDAERSVRVLMTLRADFFGHATAVPGAAAALERATVVVPPMTEEELRAAIEGPAQAVGLRLEPGLADVVVADVADRPGALPLVSHAMYETWRRRRGRMLTIADHREAGGVDGAIARTADELYEHGFDGSQQALARSVLLRLTEPGEGTEDTRRRVPYAEIAGLGDGAAAVVERLVAARLLTVDHEAVEIAHEALLRAWPRLRSWIDDDREALRTHRRITRSATEWEAAGRGVAELYRGSRLDAAIEWREQHDGSLNDLEADFLDASAALRRQELAEVAERAAKERRTNRRLRLLLGAAVVALVGAMAAASVAVGQRNRATDLAAESDARAAAGQVAVLAQQDPTLAWLLAAEAHHLRDLPETRAGLQESLTVDGRRLAVIEGIGAIDVVGTQPSADRIVTVGPSGVRLWHPSTGAPASREALWPGVDDVVARASTVLLAPDGGALLALLPPATGSGSIDPEAPPTLVGGDPGEPDPDAPPTGAGGWQGVLVALAGPMDDPAHPPVWSFDVPGLVPYALAGEARRVAMVDGRTLTVLTGPASPLGPPLELPPGEVAALAIDGRGERVAVAISDAPPMSITTQAGVLSQPVGEATVLLVDASTGQVVGEGRTASPVSSLAFDPTGSRLGVTTIPSGPGTAAVQLDPGPEATAIAELPSARTELHVVDSATLAPIAAPVAGELLTWDGDRPVTVDDDGRLLVWRPGLDHAGAPPLSLPAGRPSWVGAVHGRLVTGTADGARAEVWDLERPQGLLGNPVGTTELTGVVASPDSRYLIAQRVLPEPPGWQLFDSTSVVVIDAGSGEVLAEESGRVDGVSTEGELLVNGTLRRLPDLALVGEVGAGDVLGGGLLSPTGSLVAVPRIERLELRDPRTGDEVRPALTFEGRDVAGTSFSADGRLLAVWFRDAGAAEVLELPSGERVGAPVTDPAGVVAMALSPDGRWLAVGLGNGNVAVRRVGSGDQPWLPMRGLPSPPASLRFGPLEVDRPLVLVAVGTGGETLLYEPLLGHTLGSPLPVRAGTLGADVALLDGDLTVVVASTTGVVTAPIEPSTWAATACWLAGRDFTAEEWSRYLPGRAHRPSCKRLLPDG